MGKGKSGNLTKLCLLLSKNCHLQWHNKLNYLLAITQLITALIGMVIFRKFIKQQPEAVKVFSPVSINEIDFDPLDAVRPFEKKLLYSPKNDIYEKIVKTASEKLKLKDCVGYLNARKLEAELMNNSYFAGVEFDDETSKIKDYPIILKFSLRFPSELRGVIDSTWETTKIFGETHYQRNPEDDDGGYPVGYIREGFLQVQHAVTMSFLELATNKTDFPTVELQRFPIPEHISDRLFSLGKFIAIIIIFGMIMLFSITTVAVADEKELQLKEIMSISGVQTWMHWLGWFITFYTMLMTIASLFVITLTTRVYDNVAVLNNTDWLPLLFVISIYCLASVWLCFLVATLCSTAIRAAVVIALLQMATYLPILIKPFAYSQRGLMGKIVCSIFPNMALYYFCEIVLKYESMTLGLQWSNIAREVSPSDPMTALYIILMLFLDSILFLLLCLYIEQINTGEYHMPQKWNFPCHINFWRNCFCPRKHNFKKKVKKKESNSSFTDEFDKESLSDTDLNRENVSNQDVGIRLENLQKKFRTHYAVKGITMNMYFGEIVVLLGHNGAGKTTTILMLTGILNPTKGTAYIDGYNIHKNLSAARQSLGLCPQHNILFKNMSVKKHLRFFSGMKGIPYKDLNAEVDKYVRILGLKDKTKTAAKQLSGGMKRKLALSCAMCGHTRILICDEPTAGVDAASRRQIWNLIQLEQSGRTTLLSTHYMDEAEVVGNRIAIMNDGKIVCNGSPLQLTKTFGQGYLLICEKSKGCNTMEVTNLLRQHIPELTLKKENPFELLYRLPNKYSNIYHLIFKSLEDNLKRLKISSIGVAVPTLEDVFMKFGAEQLKRTSVTKNKEFSFNFSTSEPKKMKFLPKCYPQWKAMYIKHSTRLRRSWKLFMASIIVPLIVELFLIISEKKPSKSGMPMLTIDFTKYSTAVAVLDSQKDTELTKAYEEYVKSIGVEFINTGNQNFEDYMLQFDESERATVDASYLVGATMAPNKFTVWLNNAPLHTAPLTLNVLHNALARCYLSPNAILEVRNEPLPFVIDTILSVSKDDTKSGIAQMLGVAIILTSPFYTIHVIRERISNAKFQQFMGGASVYTYWLSEYVFNFLNFLLVIALLMLVLIIMNTEISSSWMAMGCLFLIMVMHALAVMPINYLLSYLFIEPANGFFIILSLHFMPFFVFTVATMYFTDKDAGIYWIFRIFPSSCALLAMKKAEQRFQIEQICNYPGVLNGLSSAVLREYMPTCRVFTNYIEWPFPGVFKEILSMFICAILFSIILIIFDSGIISLMIVKLFDKDNTRNKRAEAGSEYNVEEAISKMDIDVEAERNRIKNMPHEMIVKYPLVVDGITKRFRHFTAVNNISFCVEAGECFGLLGVNGAGKTTTFRMLTGNTLFSSGVAFVQGLNLRTQMSAARKHIGYCPQFDALFDDFTGEETMKIYCLLRGIRSNQIKRVSEELAESMGFAKHMEKKVKLYSGGNKRKLSTAIALLGNPIIIFMDEPTAGMDPATRHQLWELIHMLKGTGKALILTSHNMDECEDLSTRLAIMTKGELKCIGSIQHLKQKYSTYFIVKLKVSGNERDIENVHNFVIVQFNGSELREKHQDHLTFNIPKRNIKWSQIFELFELNHKRLKIEYYTIGETGLEDIFLYFATKDAQ